MKGFIKIYPLLSILLSLFFFSSCTEEVLDSETGRITNTFEYTTTVYGGHDTRVSLNDSYQYIFESGDNLFVKNNDESMYGSLELISGEGTATAVFSGVLICIDDFVPADETALTAVLVSSSDRLHTCTGGKATLNDYPNEFASDLVDAVKKYSHFTSSNTFGAKSFTLSQQSSFMSFSISFADGEDTSTPASIVLKNNDITLRSAELSKTTEHSTVVVSFVAAFPSGTAMESGCLTVDNVDYPLSSPNTSGTLDANSIYSIIRPVNIDLFTVEALEDNMSVTFLFSGDGIQYNKASQNASDFNDRWEDNDKQPISMNAGDRLYFRGKKTQYGNDKNDGGVSGKLLNATGAYTVYGNIMSLMCNDQYEPKTTLSNNYAFRGAFKGDTNLRTGLGKKLKLPSTNTTPCCYDYMFSGCTNITICPIESLPATNGTLHCYWHMFQGCSKMTNAPEIGITSFEGDASCELMFEGCSSLKSAPALPMTTLYAWCYMGMFKDCTSLVNAPVLAAEYLPKNCYKSMFNNCTSLRKLICLATSKAENSSLENWVNGTTNTSDFVFYKNALATSFWSTGNSGVLSNWTVEDYTP